VQKAIEEISAQIIVVDNASADGTAAYIRTIFPGVLFIESGANNGFSRACNIGLEKASGEFVLFLNPDTIVAENSFEICIDFFRSNSICGAIGVKMIDGSGNFLKESKRSFPSPLISFFKLTGLSAAFPKSELFGKYHLGHLDENKDHVVDVLAGAFMMIRKEVLEKVGSFDESFFMYGEDIDLSYRIQKAGYLNYYLGQVTIIHFKGESTKRESLKYVRLFYKAMSIFVKKHYSGSKAFLFRIIIQLAIIIRGFLAAIANVINTIAKRFFGKKDKRSSAERSHLFFVAKEKEWEGVELFLTAGLPFNLVGRSDSFMNLETRLAETKAEHLLFVAGDISYKDIIAQMKLHPGVMKYFHAYKSRSIVCSNDSSSNGQWYTYPYEIS